MFHEILIALISSCVPALASIIVVIMKMDTNNALQDERIKELTREVRKHNDFASRIPRIEEKILAVDDRVKRLECA